MKKTLDSVLTDNGGLSSARIINVGGFIVGSALLMYHGLWLDKLDADVFMVYMGYCAGVYTGGKWLDRKYRSEDDRDTDEDSYRRQAGSDSSDEYSVDRSRGRQL